MNGIPLCNDRLRAVRCPGCASVQARPFYEVARVPTQSNRLLLDRAHAVGASMGDLCLASCQSCGFVWNTAFRAALADEGAAYETTQACSPVFNDAAKAMARGWIDRYRLEGKTIVEIGCGNGEFLAMLCTMAGARGIGFDPLLDPERVAARDGLVFIRDSFEHGCENLTADFIYCRHTLEHVAEPEALVRTVRRAIGNRDDTVVAFEVPDVLRILREGAFWDVYYEHCSYFSPGSLARLFRAAGFEVLDLHHEYAGQYVVIEARRARGRAARQLRIEEDLTTLAGAVSGFAAAGPEHVASWNRRIGELLDAGRRLALWGSGSKAVGFLTAVARGNEIPYVVDINPRKQGTYVPATGQKIVSPAFLREYRPDVLIVMNPVYRDEIRQTVDQLGLVTSLMCL